MSTFIDHLGAIVVGAIVLAALSWLVFRGQSDGVQSATFHATQRHVAAFGETMRLDLESLSTPVSLDGSSGTFAFRARLTPHDTTQHDVVYQRVLAETRNGHPLYTVTRTVDGIQRGGSSGLLRTWYIEAQTAAGTPAVSASDVSQVYVSQEGVAPFASNTTSPSVVSEQMRWEITVVPTILHYTSP